MKPLACGSLALLLATTAPWSADAQKPAPGPDAANPTARSADRLRALQKEADALAAEQRTLLGELRKLELDRQISLERLAGIERDRREVQAEIERAERRAAELALAAESQLPDVEAQLVHLYKQGRAGYWRLLLTADDLQAVGRAYRTASMLTAMTRARVEAHYVTVDSLAQERRALQARADELAALHAEAGGMRATLEKAVATRTALVNSIDARRDLNAQLIGELQTAQERLHASLAAMGPAGTAALPLRPFQGDLPWPARGPLARPFGRQAEGAEGALVRNGIELTIGEGQPVHGIHEGVVAFAGPFAGYGQLVILDHGARSHSLYGYLAGIEVNRGTRVDARARLGTSGRNPGGEPGLYFELRVDGTPVDPLQWLRR